MEPIYLVLRIVEQIVKQIVKDKRNGNDIVQRGSHRYVQCPYCIQIVRTDAASCKSCQRSLQPIHARQLR